MTKFNKGDVFEERFVGRTMSTYTIVKTQRHNNNTVLEIEITERDNATVRHLTTSARRFTKQIDAWNLKPVKIRNINATK